MYFLWRDFWRLIFWKWCVADTISMCSLGVNVTIFIAVSLIIQRLPYFAFVSPSKRVFTSWEDSVTSSWKHYVTKSDVVQTCSVLLAHLRGICLRFLSPRQYSGGQWTHITLYVSVETIKLFSFFNGSNGSFPTSDKINWWCYQSYCSRTPALWIGGVEFKIHEHLPASTGLMEDATENKQELIVRIFCSCFNFHRHSRESVPEACCSHRKDCQMGQYSWQLPFYSWRCCPWGWQSGYRRRCHSM